MKVRTHYNIINLSFGPMQNNSLQGKMYQRLYCIGAVLPDLSIMQFYHRHYYKTWKNYIYAKIIKLKKKSELNAHDMLTLGEIVHYLSDFSCSVHKNAGIGNSKEHIIYERKLNKLLLSKKSRFKGKCIEKYNSMPFHMDVSHVNADDLINLIEDIHANYENKEENMETDVITAMIFAKIIGNNMAANKLYKPVVVKKPTESIPLGNLA